MILDGRKTSEPVMAVRQKEAPASLALATGPAKTGNVSSHFIQMTNSISGSPLLDTDILIVNRGGVDYQTTRRASASADLRP